jgi:polyhydroxyalkanoate synthesis repressor PhaR
MKAKSLRVIKKYPNRRLYDTATSMYITLSDIRQFIVEQEDVQIIDAKTNEDLTRSILLQIILEEEGKGGQPLFSAESLTHMIRFYGNAMQGVMGQMMEQNLQGLLTLQEQILAQSRHLYDPKKLNPLEAWQKLSEQPSPIMQDLLSGYMAQSQQFLTQMQRNVADPFQMSQAVSDSFKQWFGGKK